MFWSWHGGFGIYLEGFIYTWRRLLLLGVFAILEVLLFTWMLYLVNLATLWSLVWCPSFGGDLGGFCLWCATLGGDFGWYIWRLWSCFWLMYLEALEVFAWLMLWGFGDDLVDLTDGDIATSMTWRLDIWLGLYLELDLKSLVYLSWLVSRLWQGWLMWLDEMMIRQMDMQWQWRYHTLLFLQAGSCTLWWLDSSNPSWLDPREH